jgi:uncharacterized protein (DUF2164 family)
MAQQGATMEIELTKEVEKALIESIRRYVSENMETEIGELQASLFLKYCLEEVGPCVYNSAIADAQRYLQEKVTDLENVCYAPQFGYWNKAKKAAARRPAGKK